MKNQVLKSLIKNNSQIQRDARKLWKNYYRAVAELKNNGEYHYTKEQDLHKKLKEDLKDLVKDWKPSPTYVDIDWCYMYMRNSMRDDIRFYHIAYGLIKGRKYEEIEQPRPEKKLTKWDWSKINELVAIYKHTEEVLRAS